MTCSGDASQICGDGCHNSVYQTSCTGSACGKWNIKQLKKDPIPYVG